MSIQTTRIRTPSGIAVAAFALLTLALAGCGRGRATGAYTVELRTIPDSPPTGQVHLIFDVRDPRGNPATGKSVDVTASLPPRPPLPEMAIREPASEEAPGRYGVMVSLAARGTWSIGASVREGDKVMTSRTFSIAVH